MAALTAVRLRNAEQEQRLRAAVRAVTAEEPAGVCAGVKLGGRT